MEPRRVSAAALLMDELDAKGADSEPSATRVAPLQIRTVLAIAS